MSEWPASNAFRDVKNWLHIELAGIDNDRERAQTVKVLLEWVTGQSRALLMTNDHRFVEADLNVFKRCCERINSHEPLQYVTGEAWFYGHSFQVNKHVLIPRPETEELVGLCLSRLSAGCEVLDIGTGSGCIAISLALACKGLAVDAWDISQDAIRLAQKNAVSLGADVHFQCCDVFTERNGRQYDLIVSNPPYITESEKHKMDIRVVHHEPSVALFVPDDAPMLFYQHIVNQSLSWLKPNGVLAFECHEAHAQGVAALCRSEFEDVELMSDAQGKPRMVLAERPHRR